MQYTKTPFCIGDVNKASTIKTKAMAMAKAKVMASRPIPRPHTLKAKAKVMVSRPRSRPNRTNKAYNADITLISVQLFCLH